MGESDPTQHFFTKNRSELLTFGRDLSWAAVSVPYPSLIVRYPFCT